MNVGTGNFKVVLFDLGKVIIDLDYEGTAHRFAEYSTKTATELKEFLVNWDGLIKFETGRLSEQEFIHAVSDFLEHPFTTAEFESIWNSLLLDISQARVQKILELKQDYQVMVLSNTNSIHARSFNKTLEKEYGIDGIHSLVHKAYLSHEIGFRKPDQDCYLHVINDHQVDPSDVIFIDDREDNVEAARSLGIYAVQNHQIDDWLALF